MNENEQSLQIVKVEPEGQRLKPAASLENLWTVWVRVKGNIAPLTQVYYDVAAKMFLGFFRDRPLTPENLVAFQLSVQDRKSLSGKPISGRRVNRLVETAKAFLSWMFRIGHINSDLAGCLTRVLVQEQPADRVIITEDEYNLIKLWAAGKENYQTHLWLSILAYRTGMALTDCCHLRWKNVHLDTDAISYIEIERTKTRRFGSRSVCRIPVLPFTDIHQWLLNLKARRHLNYLRADGITDYVEQDAPGLYASFRPGIHGQFAHLFKNSGVADGKTFKHFRNSFCSNLVNSGASLALICQMTGHNNVKTLLGYLKPDDAALYDSLNKSFQYASGRSYNVPATDGLKILDNA